MKINFKKIFSGLFGLVLATGITFAAQQTQSQTQAQIQPSQTITQIVGQNPDFSTFARALAATGINRVLNSKRGEYTVFVPTNEAFAKLGKDQLANLFKPENRAQLAKILSYHVVRGDLAAADMARYSKISTVEGQMIKVRHHRGHLFLNGRTPLSNTDITAKNGVIHAINHVLVPTT